MIAMDDKQLLELAERCRVAEDAHASALRNEREAVTALDEAQKAERAAYKAARCAEDALLHAARGDHARARQWAAESWWPPIDALPVTSPLPIAGAWMEKPPDVP